MIKVREIVSIGLKERQIHDLPVRQPLQKISTTVAFSDEYRIIIGEELNVKEIKYDKNLKTQLVLDTDITGELRQEGNYRELIRALQNMRKKISLTPSDIGSLVFETNDVGRRLIQKFETDMKKTVLASKIEFSVQGGSISGGKDMKGETLKIGELVFKVKVERSSP